MVLAATPGTVTRLGSWVCSLSPVCIIGLPGRGTQKHRHWTATTEVSFVSERSIVGWTARMVCCELCGSQMLWLWNIWFLPRFLTSFVLFLTKDICKCSFACAGLMTSGLRILQVCWGKSSVREEPGIYRGIGFKPRLWKWDQPKPVLALNLYWLVLCELGTSCSHRLGCRQACRAFSYVIDVEEPLWVVPSLGL